MEWIVPIACSALSVLAAVGTAGFCLRRMQATAPEQLARSHNALTERFDAVIENSERIASEWERTKVNLQTLVTDLTDLGETIETKRKRIAAKEGAAKRQPEVPQPGTPEYLAHLRQVARQQGHPV